MSDDLAQRQERVEMQSCSDERTHGFAPLGEHPQDVGIGERIKQAREALGINKRTAAKKAGISEAAWSRAEEEGRDVRVSTLTSMARALGVSASFLVSETTDPGEVSGSESEHADEWPAGLPPRVKREIETQLSREQASHRSAMRAYWAERRAQLLADRGFDGPTT